METMELTTERWGHLKSLLFCNDKANAKIGLTLVMSLFLFAVSPIECSVELNGAIRATKLHFRIIGANKEYISISFNIASYIKEVGEIFSSVNISYSLRSLECRITIDSFQMLIMIEHATANIQQAAENIKLMQLESILPLFCAIIEHGQ